MSFRKGQEHPMFGKHLSEDWKRKISIGNLKRNAHLVNQRFGKLIVIKFVATKKGRTLWLCQCDCGKETIVMAQSLKSGGTKSCGCLGREAKLFNLSKAPNRGWPKGRLRGNPGDRKSRKEYYPKRNEYFKKNRENWNKMIEDRGLNKCSLCGSQDQIVHHHPGSKKWKIADIKKYILTQERFEELLRTTSLCSSCHTRYHRRKQRKEVTQGVLFFQ